MELKGEYFHYLSDLIIHVNENGLQKENIQQIVKINELWILLYWS